MSKVVQKLGAAAPVGTVENPLPTPSPAANALEQAHSAQLKILGKAVIDAVVKAGTETLRLCEYIRQNEVAPKLVSFELQALGLSKSWASKVNSVSNAADEVWNAFAAGTLTFKDVLALKSGDSQAVQSLAAEMGADVVDIKAQIQEQEDKEAKQPQIIPPTPKEMAEKRKLSNQRAFATIVKNLNEETRFKRIDFKVDGFRFVVTKEKALPVVEKK